MSENRNPGFDRQKSSQVLNAVNRFDDDRFVVYDINSQGSAQVRERLTEWSAKIEADQSQSLR